jgi:hypothetical protein
MSDFRDPTFRGPHEFRLLDFREIWLQRNEQTVGMLGMFAIASTAPCFL